MANNTIGTNSRDYSTVQGWEDAIPATMTENAVGVCYNDSEFVSTTFNVPILLLNGHANGTNLIVLSAAAGQSFKDNANVRTNALRYSTSNGVGMRVNAGYTPVLNVDQNRFQCYGIQIKCEQGQSGAYPIKSDAGLNGQHTYKDLLIEGVRTGLFHYNGAGGSTAANASFVINCSIAMLADPNTLGGAYVSNGVWVIASTVVLCSDISPVRTGWATGYSNNRLISCAAFGFLSAAAQGGWNTGECKNNATNVTAGLPGSNNQHSVTYSQTTPFTDADKDSLDLRSIAGTTLANNGFYDSTYAPVDISNVSRNTSTPTIGHWEIVTASSGIKIGPRAIYNYRRKRL